MMRSKMILLAVGAIVAIAGNAEASHSGKKMWLTIEAPGATYLSLRAPNGITTLKYRNAGGVLQTTQWPLTLRAEARRAIGFIQEFDTGQNREALILDDPDECLNVASLFADMASPIPSFDANCSGELEDETYLQVQPERFDIFEEPDNSNDGNDAIRARLIDDSCTSATPRNVACLVKSNGNGFDLLGPKTGNDIPDGYGYGADDDNSGLVLMADVGGARVFDAQSFDLTAGIIRNMAGLITTVSTELKTGRNKVAVTSSFHAIGGLIEPLAVFDFSLNQLDPQYAGFNAAYRVDSGPVVPFNYTGQFPQFAADANVNNPFYAQLLEKVYPSRVTVRAVLVQGEAPDYIEDLDGDGKYTASDVAAMGYTLISNQVEINLNFIHDNLLSESNDPECPPRTILYRDLDGNSDDGARFMGGSEDGKPLKCEGTSGASRLRRVPN